MMSTEPFGREYWEKGWEIVEGVFERDECEQIAELALKYVDNRPKTETGVRESRKVSLAYPCHLAFRRFVHDERLVGLVRKLLKEAQPLLLMDQVFMKPPRLGSVKPYHQDNAYFRCEPADEIVTAWIALDDVDVTMGCLCYIDGSHLGEVVEHHSSGGMVPQKTPHESNIDRDRESKVPVQKGGVVFHHSKTLHSSGPNTTPRWRRGFATHWVTSNVSGESKIYQRGYFHEPDYPRLDH